VHIVDALELTTQFRAVSAKLTLIAQNGDKDMASITIRNLDDETKERLRVRAENRRRSMEEEARNILREALDAETTLPRNLATAVHNRFSALGGVDLDIPVREPMREPPQPNA